MRSHAKNARQLKAWLRPAVIAVLAIGAGVELLYQSIVLLLGGVSGPAGDVGLLIIPLLPILFLAPIAMLFGGAGALVLMFQSSDPKRKLIWGLIAVAGLFAGYMLFYAQSTQFNPFDLNPYG